MMAALLLGLEAPRQIALLLAYVVALAVHFTLNRQWVFQREGEGGYSLGLTGHGARYVALAVFLYGVTAASLAILPEATGLAPFVVWLITTGIIGALNFVVLDKLVFR